VEQDILFSIALTTDEETTMKTARDLSKKITGSYCIVCEPTTLKLSTEEKGVFRLLLRYRGKSAHSAMLWKGENAIYKALESIRTIQSFKNDPAGITVNLGRINGGEKANVVPDRVDLEVDIRFPPKYTFEEIHDLFSFEADEEEITHQLEPVILDPPQEFVEIVKETTISHFATEAVRYHKRIPTCILGPGDPFMAHQIDEFVMIDDVKKAAEFYEALAKVYP
jgi:succinyl-diaminopimelate desuccinylase